MNKNRFSIIVINEKTKFNFSISLSHISVKLISLFSILVGIYIVFAFIQSYNKQTEKEQLAYIYNQQNNLMNIIKYLKKEISLVGQGMLDLMDLRDLTISEKLLQTSNKLEMWVKFCIFVGIKLSLKNFFCITKQNQFSPVFNF